MESNRQKKRRDEQDTVTLYDADNSKAFFEANEPMKCTHSNRPNRIRDLVTIVLVIFAIFMLREIVCWFFKTNHGQNEIRELREEIQELRSGRFH